MSVQSLNRSVWTTFESLLTPKATPHGTDQVAALHLVLAFSMLPIGAVTTVIASVERVMGNFFSSTSQNGTFADVLDDSRVWSRYGNLEASLVANPLGQGNPDFQYGIATCTYQDSGSYHCPDSQWAEWETRKISDPSQHSGKSADLFGLYKTKEGRKSVSDRLHKLGVTSYRFSIEWSHLQLQKGGSFNPENLQTYVGFCKHLRDEGIEPIITLHHFSEPNWFHEMGSFEKEENIRYFVYFAEWAFDEFTIDYKGHPLVQQFCTINEPAIEAFSRYVLGSFSASPYQNTPTSLIGKIFHLFNRYIVQKLAVGTYLNFNRAGLFLQGAFKAHSAVYDSLKAKKNSIQIGIVHQYLRFVPTNPLMVPVGKYFTHLINEVPLNYFKTGQFELKMPFCHMSSEGERPKTDFVGLQYYTRPMIGLMGPTSLHEPMTLMPFREDPAGLYEAIIETHRHFDKPILITENGISTRDEEQRVRYITRALFAAQKAAKVIGAPNLRGYQYWCFVRNLEWNMGMDNQDFGAYELNKDGTIGDEPKQGMSTFIKIAKAFTQWKTKAHSKAA